MDMINSQGQNIGSKSRNGNNVSMNFTQPKQPQTNPIIQSVAKPQYRASPNFPNGMKAPVTSLKTGQEDTNKIGNFLQYRTSRRNADMTMQYDKMNMNQFNQTADRNQNQNQFISKLASTNRNQQLNRTQQSSQFMKKFNLGSQQFDKAHGLNVQKFESSSNGKNMTPYQREQLKQKNIDRRYKNFDADYFNAQLPPDVNDEISDLNRGVARNYYMEHGTVPKFKSDNAWYDDDYVIDTAPVSKAPTDNNTTKPLTPREIAIQRRKKELES